jgi:dTDP-4-amino-4,6-dideoxygalactose transaminase
MFQRYDIYSKTYDIQWLETANLLETSIAIPIFVKMSEKDIDKTALTLNSIASDLGL